MRTLRGRFGGCDDLESYWGAARRYAFVLRLLAEHDERDVDLSVADFSVLRKFRGRGVGQRIAHELFDRSPGRWKAEQFAKNEPTRS